VLSDDAQRELFLVIDVGAGTTDFGVFLLQHNPDKDICLTRIIPGTIEYLPQAGNRVDDLLKSYILDAEGIDPATPEGRRHQAYLQSRIRLHKEELFRDGIVEVELANHHRVVVKKADFLSSERVKTFSSLLEQKLETVLAQVEDGYLGLMARGNLNVVLTGGGADLPMIQHMAKGVINVRGHIINREPSPRTPAWIVERYPQFEKQYPQLAVAIGGAMPDLPEMGASFSDFGGLPNLNYRP
jgi:molecular chaperone HscA